jgi:prolyl oligopeptidase
MKSFLIKPAMAATAISCAAMSLASVSAAEAAFFLMSNQAGARGDKLSYPPSRKSDQVDTLHGVKIADPFRWLEEGESAETRAWIEAQNKVTFAFLQGIPERKRIQERITELWNYERYGVPFKEGGRYFYTRNDGLQNQSVLYVAETLDAEPRVLLDPNKLSEDGTVALATYAISDDGKHIAYGLASAGSDWMEFRVRSIDTGDDLKDHLRWVKFSGASWAKDGSGFFYSRYDEPKGGKLAEANYFHKLYFHRLGTPQSEDILIYERKDEPEWGFGGGVTDDGRYLVVHVWQGTHRENRIFYKDLQDKEAKVVELIAEADSSYSFIDNDGPVFWFYTELDAPRGKVISIDTRSPDRKNWKTVIPQSKDTLQGVNLVGGKFFADYLKDAHSFVKVFDLEGKHVRDVDLPGIGSAWGFGGKREDKETFYAFTGFTTPTTIYRYDVETGQSEVFREPKVQFDPDLYETKQVFFTSKDGTRVPMFITHKKGIALDGNNPTLLYGYGGFGASETPYFSVINLVWMEMGGVYAVPNLRGGGEYGKDWHDAGRLENKQNVFDDFIAAAEWLIDNKYTRPAKLAINGGSNGGLLVGAAMTQRPELFGAAIPEVGVLDMLRFHKFTIGWAWVSDYGSPDDPQQFKTLLAYSPLHNLKTGTKYPPTLITTGDHDDRVVPAHSFKFAAALQEAHAGDAPVLIRIETKAGHGAGKPISKIIEERADVFGFLLRVLDMRLPSGFGG